MVFLQRREREKNWGLSFAVMSQTIFFYSLAILNVNVHNAITGKIFFAFAIATYISLVV